MNIYTGEISGIMNNEYGAYDEFVFPLDVAMESYCDDEPNREISNSKVEGEFMKGIGNIAALSCHKGYEVQNGKPLTATCTDNGRMNGIWVASSSCESMRF